MDNTVERVMTFPNGEIKWLESRYNVQLFSDKKEVLSNGLDKVIIQAKIFDYENVFQNNDTSLIIFEVQGQTMEVQAVKGIANMELISDRVGKIEVKATSEGKREGVLILESI